MNLPNKITISRFAAAPLFLLSLIYYDRTGVYGYYVAALVIFALAAISDGLDGWLARSLNQRTKLGAYLDPLADKLFLNSAIILLAILRNPLFPIPAWFVVLVISRDLLIVGGSLLIRLLKGKIEVRPNWLGKTAAVGQMATVIWVLIKLPQPRIIIYATALFIAASGFTYLRDGIRQLE